MRSALPYGIALPAFAALALPLTIAACRSRAADASNARPGDLVVNARDFAFDAPDTIEAGWVRVRLINHGPEPHHVQLVRLGDGHTLPELLEQAARGNLTPSWATFVGGPNTPRPGAASEVALDLAPGNYAMLCFITSLDHVPHLAKGMTRSLTVIPASGPEGHEPTVEGRLILQDFSFSLTTPLRPGHHTIRVENTGLQPHEVVMIRLQPGKTVADAMAWTQNRQATPPFETAGGTVALSPGRENFMTLDLVRGDYVLVCFVPDAHDGKPHLAHGMIRELVVQ
jgi:hypothetical protein